MSGWLALIGVGLIVGPFRLGFYVFDTFLAIFRGGVWEALTTPGSEFYHALWAPLLVFELVANTAFIAAGIVLLVLFFMKSRHFPYLFVVYAVANPIFILADAWLGSLVVVDEPMFDPETAREFSRALFSGLIWVPYVRVSKRVRNTFVR